MQRAKSIVAAICAGLLVSVSIVSLTEIPRAVAEAVKGSTVGNTAAKSASAVSAGNPALHPFQQEVFTSAFNTPAFVYSVPAGQRLVVDFVSAEAIVPRGQIVNGIFACVRDPSVNATRFCHIIGVASHGPAEGLDLFIASQQIELFVGAGQELVVTPVSDSTTGDTSVSLSGHLVSLP